MSVKKFVKNLVTLSKLNSEFNTELNNQIKALKKQIKEEENDNKVIGFQMPTKD